jgi:hypothetical protein
MIRRSRPQQQSDVDPAAVPGEETHSGAVPRWVDALLIVMVIYMVTVSAWLLCGFGGPSVTHYVGLVSDLPVALGSIVMAAVRIRFPGRRISSTARSTRCSRRRHCH